MMTISTSTTLTLALGSLLLIGTAPAFAQGVYQTPSSPNSSQSMPQPPDSAPRQARTLAPGSTGPQRMGTIGTTHVEPTLAHRAGHPAPGVVAQR